MKNNILTSAILLSIAVLAGCTSATPGTVSTVSVPVSTPVYSSVPVYVTNVVGVINTNFVTKTNYIESTREVTVTNWVAAPSAGTTTALNAVAAAAPLVPPPYNALVTPVLALATATLGFFVNRKQNQLNTATAESAQHQAAAQALAAAVQAGGATTIAAANTNAIVNGSTAAVALHLADASKPV